MELSNVPLPGTLARPTCARDWFQERKTPFQDKTRTCHLLQMYRVHGLFSPQRRKFDFLKWDENRLAEPLRFHSLTRLEPVLLPEGKEAAFLKPHASTTFSHVWVVKGTPSGSCRQPSMLSRDGSGMKQRPENVLTSHGHPTHAGDPGQNEKYR